MTIKELVRRVVPLFVMPVPCSKTLVKWFDDAKVSRFKNSPNAKRGGGPVYYSVADVERFFRTKFVTRRGAR